MSLRALKSFVVVLSLVACANEMQEIGAPDDNSGGSGSGAAGGDASSGGSGSGASGGSGSGSGSTGGTSSTGSGGKGGATGAFGGSAGVTGSGGSSGASGASGSGSGGTSGSGGAAGGAGGASGSGGSGGTAPTGECATMTEWVAGKQLTAPMNKGDELTYNNKVFTYAGDMMLWNFEAQCPPEGSRQAWCDQDSSIYKYTLVGPCE